MRPRSRRLFLAALSFATLAACDRGTEFVNDPLPAVDAEAPPSGEREGGSTEAPRCEDSCAVDGESRCVRGTATFETCLRESDGCLRWLKSACRKGATTCEGSEETCIGECPLPGRLACPAKGQRRCVEGKVETCELASGCLVWSAPASCDAGTRCFGAGECLTECTSNCPRASATQCQPGADSVQTCALADPATECLRWAAGVACTGTARCSSGACRTPCVDDSGCNAGFIGQARCSGAELEVCQQSQGCWKFVRSQTCAGCCDAATRSCASGTTTSACGIGKLCVDCTPVCAMGGQLAYACAAGICDCRD